MDNTILEDVTTEERKSQAVSKNRFRNRSRNLAVLLYPDNESHIKAFAKILSKWDYTYIKHDKDSFSDDDVLNHGGMSDGDLLTDEDVERLKKEHYHILIHSPSLKEPTQLAKELMIEKRFVQRVSNRDAFLLYLVHTGLYDKFQYDKSDVHSNRPSLFKEAFDYYYTNSEKLSKVIDIIQNKNCTSFTFALKMLNLEGLTNFALKYSSVIKELVIDQRERTTYMLPKVTTLNLLNENDDLPF